MSDCYPYLLEENVSLASSAIGKKIRQAILDEDRTRYFQCVHDACVRILLHDIPWYEPEYNEEIDDVATEVAELIGWRSFWKLKYIKKWEMYLYKRIPKTIKYRRYAFALKEDLSPIKNNPNAREAFAGISGSIEGDMFSLVDAAYSYPFIRENQVFNYVLSKYCLYDSDSTEYKYLKMSLMVTILRESLTIYKLGDEWKPEVLFLLKQFLRIYRICLEHGGCLITDGEETYRRLS